MKNLFRNFMNEIRSQFNCPTFFSSKYFLKNADDFPNWYLTIGSFAFFGIIRWNSVIFKDFSFKYFHSLNQAFCVCSKKWVFFEALPKDLMVLLLSQINVRHKNEIYETIAQIVRTTKSKLLCWTIKDKVFKKWALLNLHLTFAIDEFKIQVVIREMALSTLGYSIFVRFKPYTKHDQT